MGGWKKEQKKKRWSEAGIIVSTEYLALIQSLPTDSPLLVSFQNELLAFTQCHCTYKELERHKILVQVLLELAGPHCSPESFAAVMDVYWGLMFLDNARPLQRSVLSVLTRLSDQHHHEAEASLVRQLLAQARAADEALADDLIGRIERMNRQLALANPVASIISFRPSAPLLQQCMQELMASMGSGIMSMAEEGTRLPPQTMDSCQEALSALYYLLQRFGEAVDAGVANAGPEFAAAATAVLMALQGGLLAREACVSAGIAFVAAVNVGATSEEAALQLAQCLYGQSEDGLQQMRFSTLDASTHRYIMERAVLQPRGSSLAREAALFPPFSRLCVLRGMLTSCARATLFAPLQRVSCGLQPTSPMPLWILLINGILPELCQRVECAADAHVRFHAISALHFGMLQLKSAYQEAAHAACAATGLQGMEMANDVATTTTTTATVTDVSTSSIITTTTQPAGGVDEVASGWSNGRAAVALPALEESLLARVLGVCWANLEDPLAQTVRQVQALFHELAAVHTLSGHKGRALLESVTMDLLSLSGRRKGKYLPLAMLVPIVGVHTVLAMKPALLEELLESLVDEVVCCAATHLLEVVLRQLRAELADPVLAPRLPCGTELQSLNDRWLAFWVDPMLRALSASDVRARSHVAIHALPVPLKLDPIISLRALLLGLLDKSSLHATREMQGTSQAAALVSVLRVARGLGLIHKLEEEVVVGGEAHTLPQMLLETAVVHADDAVRLDALELCCAVPRKAHLPARLELALLRRAIPVCVRVAHPGSRNKFKGLIKKLLNRIRVGADRAKHVRFLKEKHSDGGGRVFGHLKDVVDVEVEDAAAASCADFVGWLVSYLLACLYPGAPYERKQTAVDLLQAASDEWLTPPASRACPHLATVDTAVQPFGAQQFSPANVQVLLGAVVDSWDRVREGAFHLLMAYPSPLPGAASPPTLQPLLQWTLRLLHSPRVRESDAAALLLRLVFCKYVLGLRWRLKLHPEVAVVAAGKEAATEGATLSQQGRLEATFEYLDSLCDMLQDKVQCARDDFVAACMDGLCHGTLLAIRYTLSEVDFKKLTTEHVGAGVRATLHRLLELIMQVGTITMAQLSGEGLRDLALGVADVVALIGPGKDDDDGGGTNNDGAGGEDDELEDAGSLSQGQKVLTAGWLSMKEIALVLGQLVRSVPLEAATCSSSDGDRSPAAAASKKTKVDASLGLIDAQYLQRAGQYFLDSLLVMKHNGAVEKTRVGLTLLVQQLLQSRNTVLCSLPSHWLENMLARICAAGQHINDVLRRSSGIPFAFMALFMAEPANCPKTLLPRGVNALLAIAAGEYKGLNLSESNPQVHAFNCLRMIFNDTDLAVDTQAHCAEGLRVSIKAFGAVHWEVRNAAALAFAALLSRMVGYMNVRAALSNRRTTTGSDFFHRYPPLHAFLLEQLTSAVSSMEACRVGGGGGAGRGQGKEEGASAAELHPSLHPVLMLLSRLRPSVQCRNVDDPLSPAAFVAPVSVCARQSHHAVRALASRALSPLVAPEAVQSTVTQLLSHIPTSLAAAGALPGMQGGYNAVHGVLLQVGVLLSGNAASTDGQTLLDIVDAAADSLRARVWLALPATCKPAMVRAEFLSVCYALMKLAEAVQESAAMLQLMTFTVELAEVCRMAHAWPLQPECPGDSAWRKAVGRLRTLLAYRFNVLPAGETCALVLKAVLSDPSYEGRKAALKVILCTPVSLYADSTDVAAARREVLRHVATEPDFGALHNALELLSFWEGSASSATAQDHLTEWTTLVSFVKTNRHTRVQEASLRCMGCTLKHLLSAWESQKEGARRETADDWVFLISKHSEPSCPPSGRLAVCDALQASKLLTRLPTNSEGCDKHTLLKTWLVALRLMEDEDQEIRARAAGMAARSIATAPGASGAVQEQQAMASVFSHLAEYFGDSRDYHEYLLRCVAGEGDMTELTSCDIAHSGHDAHTRLFEKEADNAHTEALFVGQLAAAQVRHLTQTGIMAQDTAELWKSNLVSRLQSSQEQLKQLQARSQWAGGVTNHQDAFQYIFRILLGLHSLAVSPSITSIGKGLQSQLTKALSALTEFPLNPLIGNMLFRVFQEYSGDDNCETVDRLRRSLGDAYDAHFQPTFLLA